MATETIKKFKDRITAFTHTKGTIHLMKNKAIPKKLVKDIVIFQVNNKNKKEL